MAFDRALVAKALQGCQLSDDLEAQIIDALTKAGIVKRDLTDGWYWIIPRVGYNPKPAQYLKVRDKWRIDGSIVSREPHMIGERIADTTLEEKGTDDIGIDIDDED